MGVRLSAGPKAHVANALLVGPIAPQSLAAALDEFATRTKLQVVYRSELAATLSTKGSAANLSPEQTLEALLHGTGLRYQFINERTVAIRPATEEAASEMQSSSAAEESLQRTSLRLAQADGSERARTDSDRREAERRDANNSLISTDGQKIEIEQLIVTGSHIRGAQNLSSPVITFDREAIDRSGYSTTQDLLRSLPQNLSSVSDVTMSTVNGGIGSDLTFEGSGINLRGLGTDATLTLVNGRRLAATGSGAFVDVSLIPLSAIERVEVLTDGASALYGSDAVGGVVNMILREDFSGVETRVRYGSVTEGDHDEIQASQMLGHATDTGQVLIGYEYFKRTDLLGSDRDVFQPIGGFFEPALIPNQQRHGAFALISQRLSDRLEFVADFFYGSRKSGRTSAFTDRVPDQSRSAVEQYGGSLGLNIDFEHDWQARLSGMFDRNQADGVTTGAYNYAWGNRSQLGGAEVVADGPLMRAPGGQVRFAVGGQFRKEEFADLPAFGRARVDLERDVSAAYAEVSVPVIGASNSRTGIQRLDLTIAGRYEKYSDFGSSFNPKVGLSWAPRSALNVRTTWGTSFKAPLQSQLNTAGNNLNVFPLPDTSGERTTAMILFGNNAALTPEESKNWTVGLDFIP